MTPGYRKRFKYYIALIIPAFVIYFFAMIFPLLDTFQFSFLKWNLMSGTKRFNGLDNYIKIISDGAFWKAFIFNVKLALFTIIGSNIIGFLIAYFLNENIRAKNLIRFMFFIPNIISTVLIAFIWVFIFTKFLPRFGEVFCINWLTSISWFGTEKMATLTIIIVSIWQNTGFLLLIYTTGIQAISRDIQEAAELDGCRGINKIFKIYIPLLMPSITINLFVSIASAFKVYDIANAMTGGGPSGLTQPISMNIYQEAFTKYNMGYASTKSVILFLTVAIVTIIQLRLTRKREVEM